MPGCHNILPEAAMRVCALHQMSFVSTALACDYPISQTSHHGQLSVLTTLFSESRRMLQPEWR